MAAYIWSALNDNDILSFNPGPGGDTLTFDGGISAADVHVDGEDTTTVFTVGSKTVTLNTNPLTITTANVVFANGSLALVGDNTTGTANDDGPNTLVGGNGNDQLVGLGGADSLLGGNGNDLFTIFSSDVGGYGNDTLNGGSGSDTIDYRDAVTGVFVQIGTAQSGTGGDGNPGSTLKLISIENVVGTQFNDTIFGNNSANNIEGDSGNDTISGGGDTDLGNDTLVGGAGNDRLIQTLGNDSLLGGAGEDQLAQVNAANVGPINVDLSAHTSITSIGGVTGTATLSSIEHVFGTAGNDTLRGGDAEHAPVGDTAIQEIFRPGGGDDTIFGAEGDGWLTVADFANDTAGVTVVLGNGDNEGHAMGAAIGTDVLFNVDRVRGGSGNDFLMGGSHSASANGVFNERFRGNQGNDTIDGKGSDEPLRTIGNNDIAEYNNSVAAIIANLGDTDLVDNTYGHGFVIAGTVRDGTLADGSGGSEDTLRNIDGIVGSDFDDTIVGAQIDGSGDFRFEGRLGDDSLVGAVGTNNEAAYINNGQAVFVDLGAGTANEGGGNIDTLENINFARGSAHNDTLIGGDNALERLMGGAGDDVINGGDMTGVNYAGYQVNVGGVNASISGGTGTVIENVNDTDTLININGLWGSNSNDTLTGGLGDQWFRGRGGDDTIDGGADIDTVDYSDPNSSGVTVDLGAGTATDGWGGIWNRQGTDTLLNIENVDGSGFDDSIIGNDSANTLDGRDGDDTILGAGGDDSLNGGEGEDILAGGAGNDTIVGGSTTGVDYAAYDSATVGMSVFLENGAGTASDGEGGADTLVDINGVSGSSHGDGMTGGDGDQWFRGLGGEDSIFGGGGSDTVSYGSDAAGVTVNLGAGTATDGGGATDTFSTIENAEGSAFGDNIIGDGGDNILDGGGGNDTLDSGGGNDTLIGGEGRQDLVVIEGALAPIVVTMGNEEVDGSITGGDGGTLTLRGVEAVMGTEFNDTFNVNLDIQVRGLRTDIVQRFEGGDGADTISGEPGNGVFVIAEYRNDAIFVGGAVSGIIVNLDQQNAQDLILGDETIAAGTVRDGYGNVDSLGFLHSEPNPHIHLSVDGVVGSMHDDYIRGGAFANSIGGNTRQILEGLGGDDTIIGGFDFGGAWISYESSTSPVIVNLSSSMAGGLQAHTASDGFGGIDTFQEIDGARGSAHDDTLIGGFDDEEHFEGMGGDDSINGGDHWDNAYYRYAEEGVLVDLGANGPGGPGIARALDGTDETGTIGQDTLVEIEAAHGSDFDDSLVGGGDGAQLDEFDHEHLEPWEQEIYEGFEEFQGLAGDDTIDGGDDPEAAENPHDHALYTDSASGVIVNLTGADIVIGGQTIDAHTARDGFGGIDTLIDIDGASGSNFNDTIIGGGGEDFILGRQGHDYLDGGAGIDDVLSYDFGNRVTINLNTGFAREFQGGSGGTFWTDTILNFEHVIGSGGNDSIVGSGATANMVVGFEGDDTLSGGDGTQGGGTADTLYGGEDNDILTQTRGGDYIDGGEGVSDRLQFFGFNYGDTLGVAVNLGAGTSDANGSAAGHLGTVTNVEIVFGTAGDDILVGGSLARSSSDTFLEIFRGQAGDDFIDGAGSSGNVGRGWVDRVEYSSSLVGGGVTVDLAAGEAQDGQGGTDTLRNINWVVGSSHNDVLKGGNKANDFFERFEGRAGSDTIDGGSGIDDASYVSSPGAVFVDLGAGIAFDGWGFTDALLNIERARGSNFADVLWGSNRLDVIETFTGEGGDDTIDGGDGIDFVSWRTLNIEEGGVNVVLGEDTVNDGIENDDGEEGIDTLINIEGFDGSAADDTASGANGGDWWFRGRGGSDILDGADGIDTADYSTDQLGVIVNLGDTNVIVGAETVIGGTARDGFGGVFDSQGIDTLTDIENVLGSIEGDHITGSAGDNLLDGNLGNDTINGGDGADTLVGGAGNDSLAGGLGSDTLDGGAGNDVIAGGDDDDLFSDRTGNDTLNGGAGDDTFLVNYTGSTVRATGGTGADLYVLSPDATGSTYRITDFAVGEDLIDIGALLDASAVEGFYSGQNPITGGFLRFRQDGADKILEWDRSGGGDSYVTMLTLVGRGAVVIDQTSFLGFQLGGNAVDNLTGGDGDDIMLGLKGNDVLAGGDGDDQLFGGVGADTMEGGEGSDVYQVDSLTDVVIEAEDPDLLVLPGGTASGAAGSSGVGDSIIAAIDYTLENLENIEHLQLFANAARATGNARANLLRGNIGNDTLVGNGGDDTMDGAAGNDSMVGGTGDDVYIVDSVSDKLKELTPDGIDTLRASVTLGKLYANVEHLVLTGAGNINGVGNTAANSITGNKGKNVLSGDAGDDTLDGGAGTDTMNGGAGNDLYVFGKGDKIQGETATGGNDTVQSSVSRGALETNVENVILTGNLAIDAAGNSGANQLTGNVNDNLLDGGGGVDTLAGGSGNDTLDGGLGADADEMSGGRGNDVFIVDNAGDLTVEAEDEGDDTVESSVTITTLADNIENLVLVGKTSNISGAGNALGNSITGSGGNNNLDGGEGNDTMNGGKGVDNILGGAGDDVLVWDGLDASIDGGDDLDVLLVQGKDQDIVLSDANLASVEVVDLTGSGDNKLTVTSADVLDVAGFQMTVNGNAGDEVHFADGGWSDHGSQDMGGLSFHRYQNGDATLLIASPVDVTGLVS